MLYDTLIKNVTVISSTDQFEGAVGIKDGKILGIHEKDGLDGLTADKIIDGNGKYLIPGGVDPHVHIRYPGISHRETFVTGTQAAAAGGDTTIIEHPVTAPPQYSPEILLERNEAAKKQAIIDYAFLGAAGGEFPEEIKRVGQAGIVGYKTFLHEGPEGREKEFVGLTSKDNFELLTVLREVKKTGLLTAAHTEDNDLVQGSIKQLREEGRTYPLAHCESRPPVVEVLAVQRLITLAKEVGTRVYLVHISSPEAVEVALQARREGMEVYIETCPQYLYMDESYLEKYGAFAKCNPALRDKNRVRKMWDYIEDGSIDVVSSDHAPFTVAEKEKSPEDIFLAPAGFPGLETRLPLVFKAVKDGKISIQRAIQLVSTNPARIFELKNKGDIRIGYDADFILIDLDKEYTVDHNKMFTLAKDTCKFMDGLPVAGEIEKTIVRGKIVFDQGKFLVDAGYGKWIKH